LNMAAIFPHSQVISGSIILHVFYINHIGKFSEKLRQTISFSRLFGLGKA
jgi:hypothetical protein